MLTMSVAKTGHTCATMVLPKGSGDRYAVHAVKQMIDEVGDPEANLQTDSEGAAVDVARDAAALRTEGRHEVKVTPRGSSQSNGVVERMNQTVAATCRKKKILVENNYSHQSHRRPLDQSMDDPSQCLGCTPGIRGVSERADSLPRNERTSIHQRIGDSRRNSGSARRWRATGTWASG